MGMYGDGRVYRGRGEVYFIAFILTGACIAVFFILQQLLGLKEILMLINAKVPLEPWRYVTALFTHSDLAHLLSNMFALALFGSILEGRIGSRRTLFIFFFSGILINIASTYERSLGASGAIFGLLGTLIMLRPKMVIWLNGLPMPLFVAGVAWLLKDIMGIFTPSNVANLAHIAGLFIGLGYGYLLRKQFADRYKKKKEILRTVSEKEIKRWEKEYMK